MRVAHRLFSFAVYSSVWVSLSAAFGVYSVCRILDVERSNQAALTVFGGTAAAYAFIRLTGYYTYPLNPNRAFPPLFIASNWFFGCIGVVVFTLGSLYFDLIELTIPILSGVMALAYNFRINNRSLRQITRLKLPMVVLSWWLLTFVFPFVLSQKVPFRSFSNGIFCMAGLMLIIAVTLPFDMRDVRFDAPQMRTIPQIIGLEKTRKAVILLSLTSALLFMFTPMPLPGVYFLLSTHTLVFIGASNLNLMTSQTTVPLIFEGALMVPGILMLLTDALR